jgi:hypothetical protein
MAKAHITTKEGTTINLEGTPDEVAALVAKFGLISKSASPAEAAESQREISSANPPRKAKARSKGAAKGTITSLIADMISDGVFKKPRLAGDIRKDLEQAAHFFDRMTVNTALRRAVKKKELRRIKQGKNWAYVG